LRKKGSYTGTIDGDTTYAPDVWKWKMTPAQRDEVTRLRLQKKNKGKNQRKRTARVVQKAAAAAKATVAYDDSSSSSEEETPPKKSTGNQFGRNAYAEMHAKKKRKLSKKYG
jgi:hypothetical protein